MNSPEELWQSALSILKNTMSDTVVNTWFDDSKAIDFLGDKIIVYTPTSFKKDFILSRYINQLTDAFHALLGESVTVSFDFLAGETELSSYNSLKSKNTSFTFGNNDFSFDTFVIGNSNKFAHAAAVAVAHSPARAYNLLFIYGGSGLGKTHLLYAIVGYTRENMPDSRIVYIKGDDFTNDFISAIQINKSMEFREKYRMADLLLVDDIQFIAGKERTQEEFFHTFNSLYESGKQIVMTSDRPPKEIALLEDRLRTRFESGLITDIQPPEFETRMAIIKNKANHMGLELSQEIVEYIATNITSNVRQLEGTVKKIYAFSDLMKDNVDITTVERAIQDILKEHPGMRPTPEFIISQVCNYFSVSEKEILGQKRERDIVQARQITMYLIRQMTDLSLPDIGKAVGNKEHSTVLHSIKKVEDNLQKNEEFSNIVKSISSNIINN
jgi:chromosomal replication initiator protein